MGLLRNAGLLWNASSRQNNNDRVMAGLGTVHDVGPSLIEQLALLYASKKDKIES